MYVWFYICFLCEMILYLYGRWYYKLVYYICWSGNTLYHSYAVIFYFVFLLFCPCNAAVELKCIYVIEKNNRNASWTLWLLLFVISTYYACRSKFFLPFYLFFFYWFFKCFGVYFKCKESIFVHTIVLSYKQKYPFLLQLYVCTMCLHALRI